MPLNPFLGEISIYAFGFPPRGSAQCNGQLLSIQQNAALFALLGTTFGGNGQTTFGLPNLQSRWPVGPGQGSGLSPYTQGEMTGEVSHTLNLQEIPLHTHTPQCNKDAGTSPAPGGSVWAADGTHTTRAYGSPSSNPANMLPLGNTGSSAAHENRQPL